MRLGAAAPVPQSYDAAINESRQQYSRNILTKIPIKIIFAPQLGDTWKPGTPPRHRSRARPRRNSGRPVLYRRHQIRHGGLGHGL